MLDSGSPLRGVRNDGTFESLPFLLRLRRRNAAGHFHFLPRLRGRIEVGAIRSDNTMRAWRNSAATIFRVYVALAPTPTFPRKRGKELKRSGAVIPGLREAQNPESSF
jgi:hypothetical protein